MANRIVNENYEQTHKEKDRLKKTFKNKNKNLTRKESIK
jgi:hypothetical protein